MVEYSKLLIDVINGDFSRFSCVYDFHFNIENYISASNKRKITDLCSGDIFSVLCTDVSYMSGIRLKILDMFGLKPNFDYGIDSKFINFAMLSEAAIKKLISYLGAIMLRADISKIISKKSLVALKEVIGDDVYNFVLRRSIVLKRRIPECEFCCGSNLQQNVVCAGRKVFELAMSGMPQPIIDRFNLRFDLPYDISINENTKHAAKSFELLKYVISVAMADNAEVRKCL